LTILSFLCPKKDLANPLVRPHLEFYPELTKQGHFKLSQSKKWLEDLAPEHRAPMCEVDEEHYYLFEPVELISGLILIPIYFYSQDSQLYSKCIAPDFGSMTQDNKFLIKITIPQDIQFDHPNLFTIPTSQFKKSYLKIEMNGLKLSENCGDALYGISF
jgi:hypothetical protein